MSDEPAQLRRLVEMYARTMDDRDEATLAGLFVPGGRLVIVGEKTMEFAAPDGFGPIIASMARYAKTFYFVGNHICEIDRDRATGETYAIGHHYEHVEGGPSRVVVNPIRYRDVYVRAEDAWRFQERVATILWTERREL